jgi:hypothetical protein
MNHRNGLLEQCAPTNSSRSLEFQFENLDNFKFVQRFNSDRDSASFHDHGDPSVVRSKYRAFIGNARVLTGPEDQTRDLILSISCHASQELLTTKISYETSSSSLFITLPSLAKDITHQGCLAVDFSMSFRRNISLNSLSISLDLTNVEVMPGIDLIVLNRTNIKLSTGTLTAHSFFESRKTYIDIDAGSVEGEYGLYDVLSISTKAGSIRPEVIPKSISIDKPAPAELLASTLAGSIDITFPPANTTIPERDYYTTIKTQEGSIRGNYIHGKSTTLSTNAGSIIAKILPFFTGDSGNSRISTLSTTTDAGKQEIELLSPYNNTGAPIREMASQHLTGFASLKLKYPSEWEGFIDGKTNVGNLALGGSNLTIIEEGRGVVGHYVKAKRGDGDNELKFRSTAGSARAVVG